MLKLVGLNEGSEGERSERVAVTRVELVLVSRQQGGEAEGGKGQPGTQPNVDECHADTRSTSPSPSAR